jgi:drug/metabolite transporter, DME family
MAIGRQGFGVGVFYVLIANFGWSLSGLFVRLINSSDANHLTGWQINCWRGFWMAVALLCYIVVLHGRDTGKVFKSIPPYGMVLSALCFALGTTLYVSSLILVNTATVSIIGATSPIVTGLLSRWITGERPGAFAWVAAFVAVLGISEITLKVFTTFFATYMSGSAIMPNVLPLQDHVNYFGLLLCFGVPITFAGQTLMLRRYRNFDMMPAIFLGGVLSFVVAGIVSSSGFSWAGVTAFNITAYDFFLLMLMGPLQLAIPLVFYGMGARSVPAITLSLLAMMDAVINPLWPWIFVGETPSRSTLVGCAIILIAVALSVVGQQCINARARPA